MSRAIRATSERILSRENARSRAHSRPAVTTQRPGDPDFELINRGGGVSSRENYVDAVEAGVIDYLVFEPASPIAVRLSGDSAALRYQVSFDLVVGGDTHVAHRGWITELYERRDGRWQIVWEQATAIPNDFGLFVESIKPVS